MRIRWTVLWLIYWSVVAHAQPYFPVKLNKKWGLIDAEGKMALQPVYDAIGEFKEFGYAVMQRNGGVGLLNAQGKEIIPPRYDDLKVLDSLLMAVMDNGEWQVVNLHGEIVLPKGYERLKLLNDRYIAFRKNDKWGLVDNRGRQISPPKYDDLRLEKKDVFLVREGQKLGLLSADGDEMLPGIADEINIFNDSLFFYKSGSNWGAVDENGANIVPPKYEAYTKISDTYIKLISNGRMYVYSIACRGVITQGDYDDYYAFSRKYLIVKKNRQLGLMDWCGSIVLQPQYHEIQEHEGELFRVNFKGKWGIVETNDKPVGTFQYDYIAPLRGSIGVIKKGKVFGIINFKGEEVVVPQYQRIEIEDNRAKAYTSNPGASGEEALTLLDFDENGQLTGHSSFEKHFVLRISGDGAAKRRSQTNNYVLDQYEWFYSPGNDRWGLRRLADGAIQIEPNFSTIKVYKELGFTLVGIEQSNKYEFERTTYRFSMVYGVVRNEVGLLVTDMDFLSVQFEDFEKGNPTARCVFSNGRHGLMDQIGRIICKDYAFIGDFQDGVARISIKGRLSGSMKHSYALGNLSAYLNSLQSGYAMLDYTQYDQLFKQEAVLICEGCEWGYIDSTGRATVTPGYTFAQDFTNGVGIVACDGKWGMVNAKGQPVIPCQYDGIEFLKNTDNKIVRLYVQTPKYGLIDTLGQLAVDAVYDELGFFREGRLAVKRNGLWGFVNDEGLEVIPCRFREVSNFYEGLAAVKIGRYWGFIDKQGDIVIDFKYTRVGNFQEGLAWVGTSEGTGFINRKEQFVIPPRFEKANDFDRGVARVVVKGEFALIDREGKYIAKPQFVSIDAFNEYGLALVTYGKNWLRHGVISLEGKLITTQAYNEIQPYSEGFAVAKLKDSYGYIDTTGQLVIPCTFSKASAFFEGRAAVQRDGSCGYINKTGNEVVPFEFSK
ncbi:MAG: WG repeat-containing protein [Saprospiraceae bacterium]|nr:WG repeat-containing protein [Saprospiraceae bacterium]